MLLILNYHSVTNRPKPRVACRARYTLSPSAFETQLDIIRALEIPVVPLSNALQEPELAPSSTPVTIALTFDDGHPSDSETVAPLLSDYRFKATFFPTLLNLKPHSERWRNYRALSAIGHGIGAHGISHRQLCRLMPSELQEELIYPKALIEDKMGEPCQMLAYPQGRCSRRVIQAATKAGYQFGLTTGSGWNRSKRNAFKVSRWNITRDLDPYTFRRILLQSPWLQWQYRLFSAISARLSPSSYEHSSFISTRA